MFATKLQDIIYSKIAKPIFFSQNPEKVHDKMMRIGVLLGKNRSTQSIIKKLFAYQNTILTQNIHNIEFKNPIGLSAGFDKNAKLTQILHSVGFGFEIIGSITAKPFAGNPKPRLWRLPKNKALQVYYGLMNDGAERISQRLENQHFKIPIGVSIAKTNIPETSKISEGIKDYIQGIKYFLEIGDFFTINISCPNTCNGQPFLNPNNLDLLLTEIDTLNIKKPIFLKISADISIEELNKIFKITDKHNITGFTFSNLTKKNLAQTISADEQNLLKKGGISGKPTKALSNKLIAHTYKTYGSKYIIIGVGGVFNAQDAYRKIKNGASLVQLITGMIYNGPQTIGKINHDLALLLKKDGFTNIKEAVGINIKS